MCHNIVRLSLGGILLIVAACAPQSTPSPTPTLPTPTDTVPPPTATLLPPTATSLPPTLAPTNIPAKVIADIDAMLAKMAGQDLLNASILIGRQGQVLLSQGYGLADRERKIPNTAQTRFRLGSITKQFTAMAILLLEAQGKLNVQDRICNYISDCPTAWQSITIHQLLTHTSGIPDYTTLPDFRSLRATPTTPDEIIARFKDLPLQSQPGEKWIYSSSGYILLGYIIEQVSGQTYEAFLQRSIFTPLNLQNTGYNDNETGLAIGYWDRYSDLPADYIDMSIPYSAYGLYSTVGDLYIWEKALSTDQLIPQRYLNDMFAPQFTIRDSEGWAAGYGWLIGTELDRPIASHSGAVYGFSAIVTRYLDDQTVIIVLSNLQDKDVWLIENIIAKKLFGVH